MGFRPFVYSLALRLDLSGAVWNNSDGVVIEVEGRIFQDVAFDSAEDFDPRDLGTDLGDLLPVRAETRGIEAVGH